MHSFRDNRLREVGRYLSLERLIEESKEEYYACLHRCSQRWHEGRH